MICVPDFHSSDFHPKDFQTTTIDFIFSLFTADRLPDYFRRNDSYQNSEGEGLLIRYLTIFGNEIDQEIIPTIECYLNIIDAQECDAKFLTHISDVLGNPPDIFGEDDKYRNLLSYICSVYKIKGTKPAYELFFSILGFDIDLVEIEPKRIITNYDANGLYDSGLTYDQGDGCVPCSEYDITFYPKDIDNFELNPEMVAKLKAAIKFNEPINAKLRNLTLGIVIRDTLKVSMRDKETHIVEEVTIFDMGKKYDDNEIYDFNGTIAIPPILQTIMKINFFNTGNDYELSSIITQNFEGDIDYGKTLLTFIGSMGNTITYTSMGTLVLPTYGLWKINSKIIKPLHQISQVNNNVFRLTGTITLVNGMKANVNTLINLGNNDVKLFFI